MPLPSGLQFAGETISVLIPTYNRAAFLPETLRSVFAQTLQVDEVIVVDDGSTDNTQEALQAFRKEHPEWCQRLQVVVQKNQGQAAATNLAIAKAVGQWIAFNDSDDLWELNKLEEQFRVLAQHPDCPACFTDAAYINHGSGDQRTAIQVGSCRLPEPFGRLNHSLEIMTTVFHGIYVQTLVVRAEVLRRVGGFDPGFRIGLDVDYLFRLSLHVPLCYVNQPLVRIDRTPNRTVGLTVWGQDHDLRTQRMFEGMFVKWCAYPELAAHSHVRRLVEKRLVNIRSAIANIYLFQNEPVAAKEYLSSALGEKFRMKLFFKLMLLQCVPARLVTVLIRWRWKL